MVRDIAETTQIRSFITFRTKAFNLAKPSPEFFHDKNFGDDLALWFGKRLAEAGWTVEGEIGQEDHGWYITFRKNRKSYDLIVQALDSEGGVWLAWVELALGVLPSIFGGRKKPVPREPVAAVHKILQNSPEFSDVNWFTREEFHAGREGAASPFAS